MLENSRVRFAVKKHFSERRSLNSEYESSSKSIVPGENGRVHFFAQSNILISNIETGEYRHRPTIKVFEQKLSEEPLTKGRRHLRPREYGQEDQGKMRNQIPSRLKSDSHPRITNNITIKRKNNSISAKETKLVEINKSVVANEDAQVLPVMLSRTDSEIQSELKEVASLSKWEEMAQTSSLQNYDSDED